MTRAFRAAALLFFLSIAFQTVFIRLDVFPSDEGLALLAAGDIADGRLLYRDTYVPLTPLSYLVQGTVFKLFGKGMLQSRCLLAVVYAASVAAVFTFATRCLPFGLALLAGLLTIPLQLWVWPHAQFYSYTPLAVLFSLIAVCLAWSIEAGPRRCVRAAAFGVALGLSAWAKPNIGVMTGAGVLVYWLTGLARSAGNFPALRPRSLQTVLREGFAVLAGMALVSALVVWQLLATGTLRGMIESLTSLAAIYNDVPPQIFPPVFPVTGQIESLRLNPALVVPGILSSALMWDAGYRYLLEYTAWVDLLVRVVYHGLIFIQGAVAVHLCIRLRLRTWTTDDEATLLLLCATFFLYLTILPHAAVHYLMPAQLPAVVLACVLIARSWCATRQWVRHCARAAAVTSCAVFVALSAGGLWLYVSHPRIPIQTNKGAVWMDPVGGDALKQMMTYAAENIPPGTRVFTYPYFPLFHFLSDLPHPTRFVDLRPGSPGISAEDEIIRQLETDHVDVVIGFTGSQYPGIESFEAAYPRLEHYLSTHFRVERNISSFFGTFAEVRHRVAARQ